LNGGVGSAQPLVSLLSDFGLVDPFVAEMKAVILAICPRARIVDVSHGVDEFDIRMGAFLLAEAAQSFPAGTVHVAVVDPGVGSKRRGIVVETEHGTYVGPDNGLLIPAAMLERIVGVFEISNPSIMAREVSSTFHGRDVFAPTAAHIACGRRPEECGPRISNYVPSPFHDPVMENKKVTCEILHVDRFGNLATNLTRAHLKDLHVKLGQEVTLSIQRRRIHGRIVRTFSDLHKNEVGLMLGSHGFIEIVCGESNAAKHLRIRRGRVVRVSDY
jgi:S-adenosylmethionine hydrolase